MPTGLFDDIVQPVGKTGLFDDLVSETPTEEAPSVLQQIGQGATPKGLYQSVGKAFNLIGQGASAIGEGARRFAYTSQGYEAPTNQVLQAGQTFLPIPMAHDPETPAIPAGVLQMLEGLFTPENVATAPFAIGRTLAPRVAQGAFASQMIPAALESAQIAGSSSAPSRQRFIEGTKALLGAGLSASLAKGAATPEAVKPSGLKPVDFRDIESIAAQERGYGITEGKRASQSVPQVIGEQRQRQVFYEPPAPEIIRPTVIGQPPVEPSGGEISYRLPAGGYSIPSARQSALPQPEGPRIIEAPSEGVTGPEAASYRRPQNPPTQAEYERQQGKRSVEEGLTQPSGYYTGSEQLPYAKEAQYPPEGGPQGTLSKLQSSRILAGKEGVRAIQSDNPPMGTGEPNTQAKSIVEPKPEIVKLSPSKIKNKLGDPMGTTYRATQSDFDLYNQAQTKMKEIMSGDPLMEKPETASALQEAMKQNETIKNKYGGMPPQPPAEPAQGSKLYSAPGMLFDPQFYKETAKGAKDVGKFLIDKYSEPLLETLGQKGGPTSKKVTEEAGQIISRHKELYGELTPTLDKAKKQLGSLTGAGTQWTRKLNNVTEGSAFNNFFGALEKATPVPANASRAMRLASDANLEGGRMAQRANPGFIATGKPQRMLTSVGYDFIVKGGKGLENLIEGVAKLNGKSVQQVKTFFENWGKDLRDPAASVAWLEAINQDFTREFPRTVTHVKTPTGWHEVVIADPFNYLENMAQRISSATAFRETYPLVKDSSGKWVSSGIVEASREAVKKENGDVTAYDNLMRTLQGHPLDTFKGSLSSTASTIGSIIGSPLKALMLSANAPVNIGELVSGAPQVFLGYGNFARAVKELAQDKTLWDQMELIGARNKAQVNMSFDPSAPARSISRIGANSIRKVTGQQFLNEVQEGMSGIDAKVYIDRIKNKEMSQYGLDEAHALFRMMGWTKEQATKMVQGDPKLLQQFQTKAAGWLTGGNKAMAEMSRLGVSRAFNSAFWFHSYPQTRLNQLRSNWKNLVDDTQAYLKNPTKKNFTPMGHNLGFLMKQLAVGAPIQGAITLGTLALITGGVYGLTQIGKDAKEDPINFYLDTITSNYGGPLAVLRKLAQNAKDGDSLEKELSNLSPPVTVAKELYDMGLKTGRYEGLDTGESISKFLESKTPATKAFKTGMAVFGLSETDLELQTAIKAFYKWRREQPGFKQGSGGGGTPEQIELRTHMKKVKKALEDGSDWVAELKKVSNLKAASRSLQAGTLLELQGKALSPEQLTALRTRIGGKLVDKLLTRDAMIREVARTLNEKDASGNRVSVDALKQPTGGLALDRTTEAQRSQSVSGRISQGLRSYLQSNEVSSLSYAPSVTMAGKKETLLDPAQAKIMEEFFVADLERLVGPLVTNDLLNKRSLAQRQTIISSRIEGARKLAEARMRKVLTQVTPLSNEVFKSTLKLEPLLEPK